MAQSVTRKDKSKMQLVAQPVTLSRTPSRFVAPPPQIGEHTDAVLKEFGFSARDDRRAAQGEGCLDTARHARPWPGIQRT